MISATGPHSHSHSHPPQRGPLDLDTGRRLCIDSQKFLVPSLPVSTRLNNNGDASNKRRERSIINGTAQTGNEGILNLGMPNANNYPYHLHHQQQLQQQQNVNGMKRPHGGHENGSSNPGGPGHFHGHAGRGKMPHHPTGSPNKDAASINSMYYQHNSHTNGSAELQHRAHHQMPTNPSNYHHLSRSSMPVPCSSPAAASSASPKSVSPAVNGIQHSSVNANSYSSQHGDLSSLASPLRFYPGGLPHPTHPVSFYAVAAAAAAAGQHHGLPYSLFSSPYAHSAAATSYLDNFHSSLLAQQHEHLRAAMGASPSPSPPARPASSGFQSRSPLASPNISPASLQTKYQSHGPGPMRQESGPYHSGNVNHGHNNASMEKARAAAALHETESMRYASMLCSGLSKGGPLGLSHMDNSNFNRTSQPNPANPFRTINDERNANNNSISSKFWNIDAADGPGKNKRMGAPEPEPKMKRTNENTHKNDPYDLPSNKSFMNGKEGSMKHRILTRSPEQSINSPIKHKMAETVFTFPDRANHHNNGGGVRGRFSEGSSNYHDHENGAPGSFLYPSPKKRSIGQSLYPSLDYSGAFPPSAQSARPLGPIATTITTDSAKYLSQIQKPSMHSSISSMEQHSPMSQYLSQNKPVQNLSATHANPNTKYEFPVPNSPHKSKSIPASPTTPTALGSKTVSALLPHDQMPVIHAFRKGSLIQLAGGQLRPVEELRMEDFHRAAATMVDSLRIVHCIVVSIQPSDRQEEDQGYKVTLAVGGIPHHQVVINASPVQPLFVVGRGWASCSPKMTEAVLQLECTLLNVGDVCITLTKMCRAKGGRNGVKGAAVGKGCSAKHKNNTNSILSTPPRRGSNGTTYASKIVKVPNNGCMAKGRTKGALASPRSPTKVKFEQSHVAGASTPAGSSSSSTSTNVGLNLTSSMLPPPSPVAVSVSTTEASHSQALRAALTQTNTIKSTTELNAEAENRDKNGIPSPKKRRWSAPDAPPPDTDAESNTESQQPKRPVSHSPIAALLP